MADLVERLRELASHDDLWRKEHNEAATEIEALRRENQELRAGRDEWEALATEFKGLTEEWQARADALEAGNQELREALVEARDVLALMDSEGERAEVFHGAPEDNIVRSLCEQIGYGAVMDSAARQWFKKDSVGAITTGTCAGTLRNLKALISRALMSDIPREQLDRIKPGERGDGE